MSSRRKKNRAIAAPVHAPVARMNGHANDADFAATPGAEALAVTTNGEGPIRVAILSFLFNWPSTGGGIVHTVELADFLGRAGYQVRHIYARRVPWGIGRVTQHVPFESLPLDFDDRTFERHAIQARFRAATNQFDPDCVIITDSWNSKPLLAGAVRGYPYLLRLQASECLCPLNNLRLLPTGEQCGNHQLADSGRCHGCVDKWGKHSGGLHQAERSLCGVGTARYEQDLRAAFAGAEAVLVVNELAAAMVGPYAREVRVVTSGFDPARFPWSADERPPERRRGEKLRLFMAGVVEDPIKGFHVLHAACEKLWKTRRDFELVATGDPPGQVNDFTRFVGWLSQEELPAQMPQADIIIVPTIAQDALGRTAVEAMGVARPVVASRIGGLSYTVADGAGLLFEPGNADDLASKLRLLLDDARLRRTLGALGRRRFDEHFTWQAIIDKHYRPLLTRCRDKHRTAQHRIAGAESPPAEKMGNQHQPMQVRRATAARSVARRASHSHRPRVALIFDDERRPETTGVYCRRALERLAEVEFFRPHQLDSIPRGKFDLFLNIDDGLRYRLPDDLRPSAWWCIDTHIDYAWSLEKARDFDLVFAAQRDGAERLQKDGIPSVHWLPLACDPEIHAGVEQGALPLSPGEGRGEGGLQQQPLSNPKSKIENPKSFDVCFVGNLIPGPRADLVRLIQQYFKNVYVGQAYFEEMAGIYRRSRIVFNRSVANDVNMRVFEALSSGSLLLTNDLADNGQHGLFRDGVHLATYRDGHDLLDKLRFYLRRDDVRQRIAAAGRAEVLVKHTYRHRMEELLRSVDGQCKMQNAKRKIQNDASGRKLDCEELSRKTQDLSPKTSPQIQNPAYDPSYYNFVRPELLALVPHDARRVLEIGCGAGRLGEALKARQACGVTGIELNPAAAEEAQLRLDRVVMADVESLDPDFQAGQFDCIVCGDVLEHLRDPARLLRRLHEWLSPDGCLVASIPNVAHRSVLAQLLRGDWNYEPAGLLDATHLRFFTRRSVEKLFYRSRFDVEWAGMIGGEGHDEWQRAGMPGEVDIGPLHLNGLSTQHAQEMHAYQYLLVARPTAAPDYGLTSIVILTHNQWAYTARCLESVRFFTDEPYELIVVDNGSTDGTPDRLGEMSDVQLIANAENCGFPAGVNQGIAAANGRQVLLLNNDVVVTTGWLRRMLEAMDKAEGRGQKAEGNPKTKIENPKSEEEKRAYSSPHRVPAVAWVA
jgi:glycosyltransferase involved in cell wall biosynthesis/2-polyprenyl-3-methyl-5-hydroxy-6-metoxy-1,4-benzoquinol methylase